MRISYNDLLASCQKVSSTVEFEAHIKWLDDVFVLEIPSVNIIARREYQRIASVGSSPVSALEVISIL